jgi:hypothetical protein
VLHAIYEGKLWGYIDRRGEVVVPPRFAEVREGLVGGPYPVREGKKWGFIDEDGDVLVEPAFTWVQPFADGLAPAQVIKKAVVKFGYIDADGAWVIEPRYDATVAFSDGLGLVVDNGEQWFIRRDGERAFRVHGASPFRDGLAIAADPADPHRRGYIDTQGRWVIEPRRCFAHMFSEGLAELQVGDTYPGRVGYIDRTGAWAIEPRFASVGGNGGPFVGGVAQARVEPESPIGFLDRTGAWKIEPRFGSCGEFSEGLASAGPSSTQQGYIDETGAFVIAPILYTAQDFHEGIACVAPDARRPAAIGYIDRAGAWVWQPAKPFGKKFAKLAP